MYCTRPLLSPVLKDAPKHAATFCSTCDNISTIISYFGKESQCAAEAPLDCSLDSPMEYSAVKRPAQRIALPSDLFLNDYTPTVEHTHGREPAHTRIKSHIAISSKWAVERIVFMCQILHRHSRNDVSRVESAPDYASTTLAHHSANLDSAYHIDMNRTFGSCTI